MGNKINHIRTGRQIPCTICGKLIYRKGYLLKKFKVFYCSKNCLGIDNAKRIQEKYKDKNRPWMIGENNKSWKGDKVGYEALHDWIRRIKGTPKKCEICGTTNAKKYEWANISKKYIRDINDWKRVCTKCHNLYDKTGEKMKRIRKEKFWSTKKINL